MRGLMTEDAYRPNPEVLARLQGVDFVAVIGPSAAGKTTLMQEAIAADPSLHLVRTTTSRPPRPDERNGVDYHFSTETEMRAQAAHGQFVQVAPNAFGSMYATLPADYSKQGTAIMAVIVQAMPDFLKIPFKRLRQIFVLPPDIETWRSRMAGRGFSGAQLDKRLIEARRSLEYAATTPDILFVQNKDLAASAAEFKRILNGERPVLSAQEGQAIAQKLLKELRYR